MQDPLTTDDVLSLPDEPYPASPADAELSRTMTHQAAEPNPAMPYLDAAKRAGHTGLQLIHGALTEAFPAVRDIMPAPVNAIGNIFQTRAAHDALSAMNLGGPLIEVAWTPAELAMLKKAYSSEDYDPSALFPDRTPLGIRQKAFQLGLKRPEKPEYVRQPGAPIMAGDQEKFDQLILMMSKRNMTMPQMAERLNVSERTLRRYINEDLNIRMRARDVTDDPNRIAQYKDMVAKGWSQPQMAKKLGIDVGTVSAQLATLNRAGIINYARRIDPRTQHLGYAGDVVRKPSMPSFKFAEDEVEDDPEYEKLLAQFLASRAASPPGGTMPSLTGPLRARQ